MMNKTKIEKKLKRKTNPELVRTIISGKKKDNWLGVTHIISGPRRKQVKLNLRDINDQSKDNETIVVPGKVLGDGEITKKIKIVALSFSKSAEEKLKKAGIEMKKIKEEIEKNPEAKNIIILNERIRKNE